MSTLATGCSERGITNPAPVQSQSHPGFDTSLYPGDAAMSAWRPPGSPYEWVGYYLQAPCHRDPSWMGKRVTLNTMGWGLAVLYVGQQTFDGIPIVADVGAQLSPSYPRARLRVVDAPPLATTAAAAVTCSRTLLTTEQGVADGIDAVSKTASEGFPGGTVIFLDIEHMNVIPAAMEAYYRAWVQQVLADGRFRVGVYVHKDNADAIYSGVKRAYADVNASGNPQFWLTGSTGFSLDKLPRQSGFSFANLWQGILEVTETWNGFAINIDVDVADRVSPSAP